MSTIRMETEDVRNAAQKIDYAVQELSLKPRRLKSAANSLKSAWSGRQASNLAGELKKKAKILDNEVANLQQLAQRMRNEINEWEFAGSSFDLDFSGNEVLMNPGEGASDPNTPEYLKPVLGYIVGHGVGAVIMEGGNEIVPLSHLVEKGDGSMKDLAKQLDGMYPRNPPKNLGEVLSPDYTPVCVYKTGVNQYAVLIAGTVGGIDGGNWNSAKDTGLGTPTEYEKQIRNILLSLDENAEVTLVGHSQGGMVADVMASDQSYLKNKNIKITNLISFGSSEVAPPNDKVSYRRFRAGQDPVTGFSLRALFRGNYKQEKVKGGPKSGLFGDHSWYDDSPELGDIPLVNKETGEPLFKSFSHVKCYPPVKKSSSYFVRKIFNPNPIDLLDDRIEDAIPDLMDAGAIAGRFVDWWNNKPRSPRSGMGLITSRSVLNSEFSSSM